MTNRFRPIRAARLAALLTVASLLMVAVPVHGAASVQIEARPLLGGRFTAGGWLAVDASLTNSGTPTSGFVVAESTDGIARAFVDLPAGANKTITLYLRPDAFERNVTIRFESPDASATASVEVQALERTSGQMLVIGDGAGNIRPQLTAADLSGPEPLGLGTADLPARPEPLTGIDGIVWADDSTTLTEVQRRSIERWIASGGQLIVVGGPDWQARTAAFTALLPVDAIEAVDGVELSPFADWSGAAAGPTGESTAALGTLRPDAMSVIESAAAGRPLMAAMAHGAGRVTYIAADVATPEFRAWQGGPGLWSRLLPTDRVTEMFFGGGGGFEGEGINAMGNALTNLPSLAVPSVELLLIVIVGYILLIGPISYIVLRRIDRRELAWVTAPILIVLFTACSYGIGASMKGSQIIVNQVTLVRAGAGGTAATVQAFAGVFSPNRATYDLTVEADALLASLGTSGLDGQPVGGGTGGGGSYVIEQGDPAHLRGLAIGVFGFESVRADAILPHEPALDVSWRIGDGELSGTVTNNGSEAMEDVAVISTGGGEMVGDLAAGASADFTMPLTNVNGSSASDQVYGFGGFDAPSQRQRTVQMRRNVIEAIVGYGGGMPGGGVDFRLGIDRGPFVIGWRPADGPMPVTIDNQAVQRYGQTVEVISGRPSLGPGSVRIEASQVSVSVVATEGEASADQPGTVTIGNGSATFSIAMPLEASVVDPDQVTLVVGPDPSMIFMDPAGIEGQGFWGPGYTLSVRDPRTGEWVDLGQLDEQATFLIADPEAALSPTGRLEARITGADIGQDFGRGTFSMAATLVGEVAP